jgi:hypothetical protein
MSPDELESGYWRAYREFYRWRAIARGAAGHDTLRHTVRHFAYAGGWKKLEPLWDRIIRAHRVGAMLPVLEHTLNAFGSAPADQAALVTSDGSGSADSSPRTARLRRCSPVRRAGRRTT